MAKKLRSKQLKTAINRKIRHLGIAVLIVLGTVVCLTVFYFFRFFNRPLAEAENPGSPKLLWPKTPANIIVALTSSSNLDSAFVLHLNSQSKKALLGVLSNELVQSLPVEPVPLREEASRVLALPIHSFILLNQREAGLFSTQIDMQTEADWGKWGRTELLALPQLLFNLRKYGTTNLSLKEITQFSWYLSGLRTKNFEKTDLAASVKGEADWESYFADPRLRQEGEQILVLNGTTCSGLAGRTAQWVQNLGGLILDVGNAPKSNYQSSVILANHPHSFTTRFLSNNLGISNVREKDTALKWGRRADIVIILGLDKVGVF
ncbi:MAG: LytR C-terminal domain-containing protein [Patescibacteria group bacterium]